MTDIEFRARNTLNVVARERKQGLWHPHWRRRDDVALEAVCVLMEDHEYFVREVSDAMRELDARLEESGHSARSNIRQIVNRYILIEPDELAEAMYEANVPGEDYTQYAADLREALAKRGLTITNKEG